MGARGWTVTRTEGGVTVARRAGLRWDLVAETSLPVVRGAERLAHQVRQDLWRALRRVRGFEPRVEVLRGTGGLTVRAGGQVAGRVAPADRMRAQEVLDDAANRRRWVLRSGGA